MLSSIPKGMLDKHIDKVFLKRKKKKELRLYQGYVVFPLEGVGRQGGLVAR